MVQPISISGKFNPTDLVYLIENWSELNRCYLFELSCPSVPKLPYLRVACPIVMVDAKSIAENMSIKFVPLDNTDPFLTHPLTKEKFLLVRSACVWNSKPNNDPFIFQKKQRLK
jgi:hypothetical protein